MSSSPAWRAASISAPMSRRWRPARSACWRAATRSPIRPRRSPLLPRIAEYGAVVSEMPLEWEPRGRDFPRRNRIVSGLSLGDGGRRGGARLRIADHRQIRRRAEPRGLRRAGLAARSARRRGQRPAARRRQPLRASRGRARRRRPLARARSVLDPGGKSGRGGRAAVGRASVVRRRSRRDAARRASATRSTRRRRAISTPASATTSIAGASRRCSAPRRFRSTISRAPPSST